MGRKASYVYGHMAENIRTNGGLYAAGMALITISMFLSGVLPLALIAVHKAPLSCLTDSRAVVTFHPQLSGSDLQDLASEVRKWPRVAKATAIPVDEARRRALARTGDWTDFLKGTGEEVFLPSLELELDAEEISREEADELLEKLKRLPQVDQVHSWGDWSEKTQLFMRVADYSVLGIVGLFSVLVLLIVFQWIRAAVLSRVDELQVHHLLGAESSFTSLPYHVEGTFHGAGGALIAGGMLTILIALCRSLPPSLLSGFVVLNGWEMLLFVLLLVTWGAFLGFLGSWLAFRHHVPK
jgi:cell division protein FtsX